MNDWEEAIEAYKKVLEVAPGNEPAKQNMAACQSAIEKQKQKEKNLYSTIFKKLAAQLESVRLSSLSHSHSHHILILSETNRLCLCCISIAISPRELF